LITGLFAIVNLAEVAPLYLKPDTIQHDDSKVTVVLANVLGSSQEYERLRGFLLDSRADLVGLIEADETWLRKLRLEEIGLIHHINAIRPNNYSLALFSKFVLHDARVVILGEGDNPALLARVQIPEGSFTAIVAHLSPPKGRVLASHRDRQFEDLARQVDSIDGALLVMGDLNSTSWSAPFRNFLNPTKLRDSRVGFGVQGTWPTVLPGPAGSLVKTPGVLRIALDHVLTSSEFVVRRRWLGPEIGSDHLPLVVEASLASQSRVDGIKPASVD
jgi:endonuclease/exonuclease/phosphatase (EEP) superfamily protein YafD